MSTFGTGLRLGASVQGLMHATVRARAIGILGAETEGLVLDFTDTAYSTKGGYALARSLTEPAKNFSGPAGGIITPGSGNSAKWLFGADGVLTETPAGGIPIQHNPLTGAPLGLIVEEQRTNVVPSSANAAAGFTAGTVSSSLNSTIAPDGTLTADTISDDGAGDFGSFSQNATTYAATVAASVFIKKDAVGKATRFPAFRVIFSGTATQNSDFYLDTATGEVGKSLAGDSVSVDDCGDYWRLRGIAVDLSANTAATLRLFPAFGASATLGSSSAAATGSIIVWGQQLEAGPVVSSYIPTSGGAVTRAHDRFRVLATAFPWGGAAGSLYVQATTPKNGYGVVYLGTAYDGGNNNRHSFFLNGSGINKLYVTNPTVQCDLSTANTVGFETAFEARYAWAEDDFAAQLDAGVVATDTSGQSPTGATVFDIGSYGGFTSSFEGPIALLMFVPRRVSDGDLPTWPTTAPGL